MSSNRIAVGASLEDRVVEHVGRLIEHSIAPAVINYGRYVGPTAAGCSWTALTPAVHLR